MTTKEHKEKAPKTVRSAVITVSTSRSKVDDKSGQWIRDELLKLGHQVVSYKVVSDQAPTISATLKEVIGESKPQVVLINGGTGITQDDVTIEAVKPLFNKELAGFGAIFAQLSMREIGAAAILSRATAGIIDSTVIFCLPGSLNACKLACTHLIFPELGHLAKHLSD